MITITEIGYLACTITDGEQDVDVYYDGIAVIHNTTSDVYYKYSKDSPDTELMAQLNKVFDHLSLEDQLKILKLSACMELGINYCED